MAALIWVGLNGLQLNAVMQDIDKRLYNNLFTCKGRGVSKDIGNQIGKLYGIYYASPLRTKMQRI
jgi:hypothetical protein